jgi:hypothetical protein
MGWGMVEGKSNDSTRFKKVSCWGVLEMFLRNNRALGQGGTGVSTELQLVKLVQVFREWRSARLRERAIVAVRAWYKRTLGLVVCTVRPGQQTRAQPGKHFWSRSKFI